MDALSIWRGWIFPFDTRPVTPARRADLVEVRGFHDLKGLHRVADLRHPNGRKFLVLVLHNAIYAIEISRACTTRITNFTNLERNTCHAKPGSKPRFVMQGPHLYVYGKFTVDTIGQREPPARPGEIRFVRVETG